MAHKSQLEFIKIGLRFKREREREREREMNELESQMLEVHSH